VHQVVSPKVFYFGTPVVLVSSVNPDGTANLAPMSSAWWLGQSCMLGLDGTSQTTANLARHGHCVLNLASKDMVDAVDRLALLTGTADLPEHKAAKGYRYEPDKFAAAGLTPTPADLVAAPRAMECPVQLEAEVVALHPFGAPHADVLAIEVAIVRTHVVGELLVPGRGNYIDPMKWDPLIMKFTEFFGGGQNVHPSRLAAGFGMQHHGTGVLQPAGGTR
jgi:flavin reductase (DIM6/NTAB) family NADH-FMN oxidoreductase RutF